MTSPASAGVRFSRTVKVSFVPPISEIDPSIISACHYSDADFERMQGDVVRTIRAVRKNGPLNENDPEGGMTERGLESLRSPAMVESKRRERNDVIEGVLDEQERQWANESSGNEDAIASASRTRSRASVDRAIVLGSSDAAFVQSSLRLEARTRARAQGGTRAVTSARATSSVLGAALNMIEQNNNKNCSDDNENGTRHCKSADPSRRHSMVTPLHDGVSFPTVVTSTQRRHRRSASMPRTFQDLDMKKQHCEQRSNNQQQSQRTTLRSMFLQR